MRRLYRTEEGKMLCGVCGGLADYLGIDATVIRVAWAALTVCSAGAGIALYIAAAIIMPAKPENH